MSQSQLERDSTRAPNPIDGMRCNVDASESKNPQSLSDPNSPEPVVLTRSRSERTVEEWANFWPACAVGVVGLLHAGIRRYRPRVLPRLTTLTRAEIYSATAALFIGVGETMAMEAAVKRDHDLFVMHTLTKAYAGGLAPSMEKIRRETGQKLTDVTDIAAMLRPPNQSISASLAWRYHHTWADRISYNIAAVGILGFGPPLGESGIPSADLDIMITLLANHL